MYGYIYKTTNLINGKIYVGLHRKSEFDNNYIGSGTILKQAIRKYGVDNFTCEVIEWCETSDELSEREIYWIDKLNCLDSEVGYNLHEGGGQPPIFIGENHPNWGKKRSQETIEKIKETKRLNPNSLKGITRTDEENITNRKAQPHKKEVVVAKNDNLIVFDTINQASKYIGIPRRSLSYYLNKYGEHKVDDLVIKFKKVG